MEAATAETGVPTEVLPHGNGAAAGAANDGPAVHVTNAFSLGWNLCLLYLSGATPAWRSWKRAPEQLPSPSLFSDAERSLICLGQVSSAIDHFNSGLAAAGGQRSFSAASSHIDKLKPNSDNIRTVDPRESICEAHLALAEALSASDERLAKAYHLGVSLATTCNAPGDRESLEREFNRQRIAQLGEWLADLTSLFPDHASRAVRLSCAEWQRWVRDLQINDAIAEVEEDSNSPHPIKRARALAAGDKNVRKVDWDKDGEEIQRSLARQGEVWKALLSGEKPGTAMLELHDYFATSVRALKHGVRLLRGVLAPLAAALLLLAFGSWLLLKDPGAGATALGLVTVAGSVGLTWKGILGGLWTVAKKLQSPVWGAALDEEIASAITSLPAGAKAESLEAKKAAPASGPHPSSLPLPEELEATPDWADVAPQT